MYQGRDDVLPGDLPVIRSGRNSSSYRSPSHVDLPYSALGSGAGAGGGGSDGFTADATFDSRK